MTFTSSRVRTLALLGCTALALYGLHIVTVAQSAERVGATIPQPECNDGIDNDRDGHVDYPEDSSCDAIDDVYEGAKNRGVFLSLTDGKSTIEPGGTMIYTLGITSERPYPQGVDVQLLLPAYSNLIGASDGGRLIGNYVSWNDVRLSPGRNRTLTVQVSIAPNAKVEHVIVAEARSGTTRAADTTRVVPRQNHRPGGARIALGVTDGKTYAQRNDLLRYDITIKNNDATTVTTDLRTQLPSHLTLHEVSGPHSRDNGSIVWRGLTLRPGEARQFFVVARIQRDTPQHTALTFKVYANSKIAQDTTTVSSQELVNEGLSVTLSDGQQNAARGDVLYYQVHMNNNGSRLVTNLNVQAALPTGTEFVSAGEGGHWTGDGIIWKGLTVSPHGKRVLQFAVRVRSDLPLGDDIRATVKAADKLAVDITNVATQARKNPGRETRPSDLSASYANRVVRDGVPQHSTVGRGMLRKYADKSEAQPGSRITYTIVLQNPTSSAFRNVRITDKLDTRYMKVIGANGQPIGDNVITWNVPEIAPGMEWRARYSVVVSPHTPHGTMLGNVVSASGEGMQTLSLSQRVYAGSTGVIAHLPRTGAGMEAFAIAMMALSAIGPAALQRKGLLLG